MMKNAQFPVGEWSQYDDMYEWSHIYDGSFFKGNVPIIIVVLGPRVVPSYEIQVEPCLMMTALISWSQTKCFP